MPLTSKYKHDIGTTAASHSHLKSLLTRDLGWKRKIDKLDSVPGCHKPHILKISDKLSQEHATIDNSELKSYTPTLSSIFFVNNHYQLCGFCF